MSKPHLVQPTPLEMVKLKNQAAQNDLTLVTAAGALPICGVANIAGGEGFALTLAAPKPGCRCSVRLASITSGAVTITTPAGVTLDGTNNTATLAQAGDQCEFIYKSDTEWFPIFNEGIAMSSV